MIMMVQQRSPGATPDDLLRLCSAQCSQLLQMIRPNMLKEENVTPQAFQNALELYQEDDDIQKYILERDDIINDLRQGGIDIEEPMEDVDFPESLTVEKFLPIFAKVSKKSNEAIDEVIAFVESKKDIPPEMLQRLVMDRLSETATKGTSQIFEENGLTEAIYTEAIKRYRSDPKFMAASFVFTQEQSQRAERLQKAIAQASGGLLE